MTVLSARQRVTFVLLLFSGVGAALLMLTWDLRPFPLESYVDDYRYVLSAHYLKAVPGKLIHGVVPLDWVGPYEPTTLFKRPGFSILLAALSALHLPFFQTILLFHLTALAILANSLLRLNYPRTVVSAMFIVCGLYPTLYDSNAVRVIREVITPALEIAIFGLCLALFTVEVKRPAELFRSRAFLALLTLLGLHWSVREEAVLLLPSVLLLVNGALWLRRGTRLRQRLFLAGIASFLVIIPSKLAYFSFAAMNKASYGQSIVNDISEGNFPRAVSALKRVGESPCDRRLLTGDEAQKVMTVSPTFRVVGETVAAALKSQPDMLYGETFSVMRVGALFGKDIGFSPDLTQNLFGRIADEVEAACDKGQLHCERNVSGSIVPLICSSHWVIVPQYFSTYLTDYVARMKHSGLSPWWSGQPGVGRLHPKEFAMFEEITRQQMAGRNGELVEFSQPASLELLQRQDNWRYQVGALYPAIMPWLMAIGISVVLLRLGFWRDRNRPWWPLVLLAMAGYVLIRSAAFAYLSTVESLNTRFISVCYPIAATFAVLAVAESRYFFLSGSASSAGIKLTDLSETGKKSLWGVATMALIVVVGFIYAGAVPGIQIVVPPIPVSGSGVLMVETSKEVFEFDGRRVQVLPNRHGWLNRDAGWLQGESATFDGWGMDVDTGRPAEGILIFADGQLVSRVSLTFPIPPLETAFPNGVHAGFSVSVPRSAVFGKKVRVFALLSGDRAGELNYPSGYPYR